MRVCVQPIIQGLQENRAKVTDEMLAQFLKDRREERKEEVAKMVEIFQNPAFGPDSFVGKLASTFQGSTETTFYVLAVYFGSVKITNTRYAAWAGIFCDLIGGIAAILVAYLFFG
jgi:hypothetical protein